MLLLIFSPKHGGSERLILFDDSLIEPILIQKDIFASHCRRALLLLFLILCSSLLPAESISFKPSKAAAESCSAKLKKLENDIEESKSPKEQKIKFSQNEVNSYLALDLCPKYDPSLKSLVMTFEEEYLKGIAEIDFDRLDESSKIAPKLLSLLFSGTHVLLVRGKLASKNGKAGFLLEEALFDNSLLPKPLVEKLITMVGRKQKPPFDPLKPSELPYGIQSVEVHPGYLVVHQ
jgi:hypothetical protein